MSMQFFTYLFTNVSIWENAGCASDKFSYHIFQCAPKGADICRFGPCLGGCCGVPGVESYCCTDSTCSGCPLANWYKIPSPPPPEVFEPAPISSCYAYIKGVFYPEWMSSSDINQIKNQIGHVHSGLNLCLDSRLMNDRIVITHQIKHLN